MVYLRNNRETHLLSEHCTFVLSLLEKGTVSASKLHEELASAMGEEHSSAPNLLSEILDTLVKIGLIETHEGAL